MAALMAAFTLLIVKPVSLGPALGALAIISAMVGALTPDLDQPTANIWRRLIGGNTVGNIFKAFSGGHRHFTHSVLGIIVIGWCLNWIIVHVINPAFASQALALWTAFMIGYISHPVLDSFTDKGVPWLWPLKTHIKIPPGPEELRVTTNSFVERVIVRSGIIIIAVLLLQRNWEVLKKLFQ
jgi:inner membrane protein